MNIFRLEKISHNAINEFDPSHTVVCCAISPIEVHGPHLPVGQDWFEAQAVLDRTLDAVAPGLPDWNFLIAPPLPIATDCVPALGSISYPPTLVRDVAYHSMLPFAKRGFARLAFSSFHGGPRHNCALEDACERLNKNFDCAAISLFSAVLARIPEDVFFQAVEHTKGRKITREQTIQDRHAGMVETSLGLHLWPELVDEGWQDLPSSVSAGLDPDGEQSGSFLFSEHGRQGLIDSTRRRIATVRLIFDALKHFSNNTYFGYPALASAKQGEQILEHLIGICAELVGQFIEQGKGLDGHSPLWKLKDVLLNRPVNHVVEDWLHIYSD
ncbi:MAG: creatininase family protein [Candidatus Alcyoniella australis]|nr:creatininase family protein [Candidatus Alcyoniella australis]